MNNFLNKILIGEYQFFQIIKFLFITFVLLNLSSYTLYLFGSSYFTLNYEDNITLNYLVSYIFLYFNLTIYVGMIFSIYNKSIFKVGLIYYLIYIVIYNIVNSIDIVNNHIGYISFVSPILFVVLYSQYKKCHSLKIYIRFILISLIIMLFQLLEIQYREIFYGFVNYNLSTDYFNKLIIYSNNLILQLLIYVILYGKDVSNNGWKFILFTNKDSNVQCIQEDEIDNETLAEMESMSIKEWSLYLTFVSIVQLAQFIIIALICILGNGANGFYELILTLIGFWSVRSILGKSFHFDNLLHCTIFSAVIFLIATKLTPSTYLSTFMPIFMGSMVAFLLYHLKIHFDKYNDLKQRMGNEDDKKN